MVVVMVAAGHERRRSACHSWDVIIISITIIVAVVSGTPNTTAQIRNVRYDRRGGVGRGRSGRCGRGIGGAGGDHEVLAVSNCRSSSVTSRITSVGYTSWSADHSVLSGPSSFTRRCNNNGSCSSGRSSTTTAGMGTTITIIPTKSVLFT